MRDHVNFIIASILPENVETMLNIRKAIRLETRIYMFLNSVIQLTVSQKRLINHFAVF